MVNVVWWGSRLDGRFGCGCCVVVTSGPPTCWRASTSTFSWPVHTVRRILILSVLVGSRQKMPRHAITNQQTICASDVAAFIAAPQPQRASSCEPQIFSCRTLPRPRRDITASVVDAAESFLVDSCAPLPPPRAPLPFAASLPTPIADLLSLRIFFWLCVCVFPLLFPALPPLPRFRNCEVVSIQPFGCFVEFSPGLEGLVHVSELDVNRVVTAEGFLANKPVVSETRHMQQLA